MHLFRVFLVCAALLLFAGCASDGSFQNPFSSSSNEADAGGNYYFSEFTDVPIPNDLSENRSDTFITFASSGVKCGVQKFSGRVDVVSLMNTMRQNMSNNNWTLRSLLRAKESVLVFEKPDRVVAIHITDGVLFTEMRVFMTSRLEGDSASVLINPYTPSSETPIHATSPQ